MVFAHGLHENLKAHELVDASHNQQKWVHNECIAFGLKMAFKIVKSVIRLQNDIGLEGPVIGSGCDAT